MYFHLMGEPLLHPLLPQFVDMARRKGFKTVLTSNGTLLDRATSLLASLPHKIQLSIHSHESNGKGELSDYMNKVMTFTMAAAEKGTCMVLRLWNDGGKDTANEAIIDILRKYIPQKWTDRPDGYRLKENIYLEFDRKFEWPEVLEAKHVVPKTKQEVCDPIASTTASDNNNHDAPLLYCKALQKQIGVLADGSLVPCCLDHNGDIILGNLLHQSLDDILSSPRARAMVDAFYHHRASEPLCKNCESALANNSFRGKSRKLKNEN